MNVQERLMSQSQRSFHHNDKHVTAEPHDPPQVTTAKVSSQLMSMLWTVLLVSSPHSSIMAPFAVERKDGLNQANVCVFVCMYMYMCICVDVHVCGVCVESICVRRVFKVCVNCHFSTCELIVFVFLYSQRSTQRTQLSASARMILLTVGAMARAVSGVPFE